MKKTVEWDVDFTKEENHRVKLKEAFRDCNMKWNAPANETGPLNKAKGTWWNDFLWCRCMLTTIRGFLLKWLDWISSFIRRVQPYGKEYRKHYLTPKIFDTHMFSTVLEEIIKGILSKRLAKVLEKNSDFRISNFKFWKGKFQIICLECY